MTQPRISQIQSILALLEVGYQIHVYREKTQELFFLDPEGIEIPLSGISPEVASFMMED